MNNLGTIFRGALAIIALVGCLQIGVKDPRNAQTAILVAGSTVGIVLAVETIQVGKH